LQNIHGYHDEPAYVEALAQSIRDAWASDGQPERLLFSFHGIPQRYVDAGDPYAEQCRATARLVAETLHLPDECHAVTFQSVFGRDEWIEPTTEATVRTMAQAGIKKVDVICPGFAVDCLETLEEIDHWNRSVFENNGGERYRYIPCLNARPEHIKMLAALVRRNLDIPVANAGIHDPKIIGPVESQAGAGNGDAFEQTVEREISP